MPKPPMKTLPNDEMLGYGNVLVTRPFTSSLATCPLQAGGLCYYDTNEWYAVLQGPWGHGDAIQEKVIHIDVVVDGSKFEKVVGGRRYSVLPNGELLIPDEEITMDQHEGSHPVHWDPSRGNMRIRRSDGRGDWFVRGCCDGHSEGVRYSVLFGGDERGIAKAYHDGVEKLLSLIRRRSSVKKKPIPIYEKGQERRAANGTLHEHAGVIKVGCRKGRHRSVALGNEMKKVCNDFGATCQIHFLNLYDGAPCTKENARDAGRAPCGCHLGPEYCMYRRLPGGPFGELAWQAFQPRLKAANDDKVQQLIGSVLSRFREEGVTGQLRSGCYVGRDQGRRYLPPNRRGWGRREVPVGGRGCSAAACEEGSRGFVKETVAELPSLLQKTFYGSAREGYEKLRSYVQRMRGLFEELKEEGCDLPDAARGFLLARQFQVTDAQFEALLAMTGGGLGVAEIVLALEQLLSDASATGLRSVPSPGHGFEDARCIGAQSARPTATVPAVYKVAQVTAAFDPDDYGEEYMRLEVDDIIVAYRIQSEQWMYGMRVDPLSHTEILACGWFPPKYIVDLAEPEECYKVARATSAFDAAEYGPGQCMEFEEGDTILVYQKPAGNWMYGMRVNPFCYIEILARGWFPPDFIAYVLEPGEFGDA